MIITEGEYAKQRNAALIYFVLHNDDKPMIQLMKRFGTPIPDDLTSFHAGMYKTVRYCISIPESVKKKAWNKCKKLGMKPYIEELENPFTLAKLERGEYVAADK